MQNVRTILAMIVVEVDTSFRLQSQALLSILTPETYSNVILVTWTLNCYYCSTYIQTYVEVIFDINAIATVMSHESNTFAILCSGVCNAPTHTRVTQGHACNAKTETSICFICDVTTRMRVT